MTVRDLVGIIPCNTPVEIGLIYTDSPRTMRPSAFSEEVLTHLCVIDQKVELMRLVKDGDTTVLRIVIG